MAPCFIRIYSRPRIGRMKYGYHSSAISSRVVSSSIMDPLSTVASSIAIIQATDAVTGLLGQVQLLVDAPEEIHVLIGEVDELKRLLGCLRQIEDILSAISLPIQSVKNLKKLIDQGCETLLELEKLIYQEFIKWGIPQLPYGRHQVQRIKWVLKMGKVRKLKERLFGIRMSLSV